jgi:hypothetical protein
MDTETPIIRCPWCGNSPCEVIKVTTPEPSSVVLSDHPVGEPTIHARCPTCLVEFQITKVS